MSRFLVLVFVLIATCAEADTRVANIELTDGTVVRGEITALVNSTYAVESESLGRIQIPQDRVTAIRYDGSAPSVQSTVAPSSQAGAMDLADLQRQMAGNPQIMTLIQGLTADPEIQALVSDPAIAKAVANGDIGALLADERFQKLMQNPKVREITREVGGN